MMFRRSTIARFVSKIFGIVLRDLKRIIRKQMVPFPSTPVNMRTRQRLVWTVAAAGVGVKINDSFFICLQVLPIKFPRPERCNRFSCELLNGPGYLCWWGRVQFAYSVIVDITIVCTVSEAKDFLNMRRRFTKRRIWLIDGLGWKHDFVLYLLLFTFSLNLHGRKTWYPCYSFV